jgi:hypothetical protein
MKINTKLKAGTLPRNGCGSPSPTPPPRPIFTNV